MPPLGVFREMSARLRNHPQYVPIVTQQLYGCAQNNSLPHFRELIDVCPEVLTMTFSDMANGTVAHFCAQFNKPDLLRELAANGVSLTEESGNGWPPILWAAMAGAGMTLRLGSSVCSLVIMSRGPRAWSLMLLGWWRSAGGRACRRS